MGRRRNDPDISGVLVVDKPVGMTSHDVVGVVRRALGMRRVGHTGTLDPAASGVLVCAVGRATRLVPYLQAGDKTYAATMLLGRETDSQDADGEVVAETDASHLDEDTVCAALKPFMGTIQQVPPMVSALKVDGERLHEKARRGEVVEREPRTVTISDLVLEDFTPGPLAEVQVLVTCSAGTYVRTIAHDLGQSLEVGGSLTALRRLANGGFAVEEALPLDEVRRLGEEQALRSRLLAPVDALRLLPHHEVDRELALALSQGKHRDAHGFDGTYALTHGGHLVGIFHDEDGRTRSDVVLLRPEDLTTA